MTISVSLGAALLSALKRRRSELAAVSGFLGELSVMIRFRAQRLAPLIEELCGRESFAACDFLKRLRQGVAYGADDCDRDIGAVWCTAANEAAFLSDDCRAALISVGESIGGTDSDGQLAVIGAQKTFIDRRAADADDEYRRKGRLIASVCPLIGLGISVMLL